MATMIIMRHSIATRQLKSMNNKTRQLLLRLISLEKDTNVEKINTHIRIEPHALMYHINILKDSGLIKNNSFFVEGEKRTVYNISSDGKKCLAGFGID